MGMVRRYSFPRSFRRRGPSRPGVLRPFSVSIEKITMKPATPEATVGIKVELLLLPLRSIFHQVLVAAPYPARSLRQLDGPELSEEPVQPSWRILRQGELCKCRDFGIIRMTSLA